MYRRVIKNDILKSKLITLATIAFVAAAAMLVSLASILTVNLFGAIDALMTESKTPHFLQMHSGELDIGRLQNFAKQHNNVDEFQVSEFLNIEGSQIEIGGNSFVGSVQDNGVCTQSETFDFLLDTDGAVIQVSDGEIYVPISYRKDNSAKLGDRAVICGKDFMVAGFLRDSQMNSSLASSKRFLVSERDYVDLQSFGNIEYLIEFRLKDMSLLGAFENEYISSGLEANGPTVTYPLFKMMNAISDGLMIAVIILISILVVAVAFMCIRFTLLAKIEDDYREIGVMKAIGLRITDIKKIYIAKYTVIALVGCIFGFLLSLAFKGTLLENIKLYMGESGNELLAFIFGIIGILIVFTAIIAYVNKVLKRFKKISSIEAIRFGVAQEKNGKRNNIKLSKNRLLDTNVFLGIKDILSRKKLYMTMLIILICSVFIMIVPRNIYRTISSKDFITYMGIGNCDVRIDIQQTEQIYQKGLEMISSMDSDKAFKEKVLLTTKGYNIQMKDGTKESIRVELGNHSVFPITYYKGREPKFEDEIALSAINADELEKEIGDDITLIIRDKERKLSVCGIYSDVTNGGKTSKAVFTDDLSDAMWSVIHAEISDPSLTDETVLDYSNQYRFAKVSSIDEYMVQMYGTTINSIQKASNIAMVISIFITFLVTLLFLKMLISKDRYSISVMKAFGFTNHDITLQYISRSVFISFIGTVLGIILANTVGEMLAGALISSFGALSFRFIVNPVATYMLCPILMMCTVFIATMIGSANLEQIKITENIKE